MERRWGGGRGSEPGLVGRPCAVVTREGEARVPRWMDKWGQRSKKG